MTSELKRSDSELKIPKIGVALLIKDKRGRILFMKRKGSYGEGTWALPGGHVEYAETLRQTAIREATEELGISIWEFSLINKGYREDIMSDRHYITFYFGVKDYNGEIKIMEPDKCEKIQFCFLDEIPSPIFDITENWLNGLKYADDIE